MSVILSQAVVGFLAMLNKSLSTVDIQCKAAPIVYAFLERPVIQLDKQVRIQSVRRN